MSMHTILKPLVCIPNTTSMFYGELPSSVDLSALTIIRSQVRVPRAHLHLFLIYIAEIIGVKIICWQSNILLDDRLPLPWSLSNKRCLSSLMTRRSTFLRIRITFFEKEGFFSLCVIFMMFNIVS